MFGKKDMDPPLYQVQVQWYEHSLRRGLKGEGVHVVAATYLELGG
jgi:hypothetical protein